MKYLAFIFAFVTLGAYADDATDILKRIDSTRAMDAFAFHMEISSFAGEEKVDAYQITGYIENSPKGNSSLIYFTDPPTIRGRKMLMNGNYIWMAFPGTTNPIRLSPMQVLLGEASNGDVARTSFSWDYDVAGMEEKEENGKALYVMDLKVKPAKRGSTYGRIVLKVDKKTLLPLSGDFYTESGKLVKLAAYKEYQAWKGRTIPMVLEITDALDTKKHTSMRYLKLADKKLPDLYFSKDYLEEFRYVALD
jgi:hypothetical protein